MYNNIKALKEKPETANVGMRWSEDEIKTLLNEIENNTNMTAIAINHKRTLGSITSKLLNIAEQLINNDGLDINNVSKKVNLSIEDINEHLLKMKNKPVTNKKKVIKEDEKIIEEKKPEIILNSEQESALTSFKEGKNIFLTGIMSLFEVIIPIIFILFFSSLS